MICPVCDGHNTAVAKTRRSKHGTTRSRVCGDCGHKFATVELMATEVSTMRRVNEFWRGLLKFIDQQEKASAI